MVAVAGGNWTNGPDGPQCSYSGSFECPRVLVSATGNENAMMGVVSQAMENYFQKAHDGEVRYGVPWKQYLPSLILPSQYRWKTFAVNDASQVEESWSQTALEIWIFWVLSDLTQSNLSHWEVHEMHVLSQARET